MLNLIAADNDVNCYVQNSSSSKVKCNVATSLVSDTEWHLYTVTYDGSLIRLYMDGAPLDSASQTGYVAASSGVINIGKLPYGSRTTFMGKIDEFRIYNTALDPADVVALYDETPVPVTLASFTGHIVQNGVLLSWNTQTEQDNLGWNVLHSSSADGPFGKINQSLVPGSGNSVMAKEYSYRDATAVEGARYYRLQQVDLDGSSELSGIIKVEMSTTGIDKTGAVSRINMHDVESGILFRLNGSRQFGTETGIYIINTGSGLKKILILLFKQKTLQNGLLCPALPVKK